MITKTINSFRYAMRGLVTVWKEESNFRIETLAMALVVFCMFYFDFSFIEKTLCILVITIVLSAEILNTAIEDLCNKVEPSHDFVIAKIKDTSSAFVLVSSLGALVVGVLVFLNHFL